MLGCENGYASLELHEEEEHTIILMKINRELHEVMETKY